MWGYVAQSLAWSVLGFVLGAQVGWDILTIGRDSRRQEHHDDT